jgi:ABC-type sulfate transport system permease component
MSPESRAKAAYDLLGILLAAFFLALPFAIYFWSMQP